MTFLVDILALAIVVICALVAYFKGFVKTFFGFISAILALILAFVLYKPLAVYIKDSTDIDDWVYESIVSLNIDKSKNNHETLETDETSLENDADFGTSGLSNKFLDMVDSLPASINESLNINEKKEQLVIEVATKVSETVVNVLAWLIIYIAIRIILLILMLVFDGIMQLPFLKTVNNVTGLIIGALMGIFRVYLLLALIYFISNVTDISGLVGAIQASTVVSHMYDNNLLINLIF
ncbi:MAG: CvpA family protein [Clostridia bacterium]|nr:CvpA family protein [Clostridia bacterium]